MRVELREGVHDPDAECLRQAHGRLDLHRSAGLDPADGLEGDASLLCQGGLAQLPLSTQHLEGDSLRHETHNSASKNKCKNYFYASTLTTQIPVCAYFLGMQENPRDVGRVVYGLRRRESWSRLLLAEKAELSQSTIQRIEAGDHNAEAASLEKIAAVFGRTMAELFALVAHLDERGVLQSPPPADPSVQQSLPVVASGLHPSSAVNRAAPETAPAPQEALFVIESQTALALAYLIQKMTPAQQDEAIRRVGSILADFGTAAEGLPGKAPRNHGGSG